MGRWRGGISKLGTIPMLCQRLPIINGGFHLALYIYIYRFATLCQSLKLCSVLYDTSASVDGFLASKQDGQHRD